MGIEQEYGNCRFSMSEARWVLVVGDLQDALEGCGRALALDPDSVELQSMRKELEASAAPADWDGLRERAKARCAPHAHCPQSACINALITSRAGCCCK